MPAEKKRRPSPLQRNILVVLAALDARRPGPVATRDIERLLEQGSDRPVYGPNLRASCRRMEDAGWLRLLRAPNLQLAVALTDTGRALATPLLAAEQEKAQARQRATDVRVLPLVPAVPAGSPGPTGDDVPVSLEGVAHTACRGDFVIRLDGTTCLQLWDTGRRVTRLEGDPLQVAGWLHACHHAGIAVGVQINESPAPADESNVESRERAEVEALLDALAQRSLYCNRSRLTTILFSPVRQAGESWRDRLQWLLPSGGFGFYSPLSRKEAAPALDYLASWVSGDCVAQLARQVKWSVEQGDGHQ